MKAMIFAAGLGTRLLPLTENRPKALVEVAGVPALQRVIMNLIRYGFDEVVINVHHFADKIEDFLKNNGYFGIDIKVSDERQLLLDTGGGIAAASSLLDGGEPFLVHNVDILTDLDLGRLYRCHCESGADATLLTSDRATSRYLLFDREKRMKGWTNVSTGEVLPHGLDMTGLGMRAFGGIHVISPSMLKPLCEYAPLRPFSIIPFYISVCRDMIIKSYEPDCGYYWFDIGKHSTLAAAADLLGHVK